MSTARRFQALISAALLASLAGSPRSVWAQSIGPDLDDADPAHTALIALQPPADPAPPTPATATPEPPAVAPTSAAPPAPSAPVAAPPSGITFNFKETPFTMVLDFFSRESGLPIIREAPVPVAAMTFVGASAYSFDDALSILNLNLAMHGVQLRRQDQFLYLATLADSAKKPGAVATGQVPADARPEQFLTLTIPLDNASAAVVAEQIKPLLGPLGGVTAVPQQNLIIITETAAQCRRIREIIQAIDVKQVDQAFRLFPLTHAQADSVVNALKGLMGERVKQTFVDKDGRQTTVQDVQVAGLNLQPDPRTNAVIAVGSDSRLKVCEQIIALLDVPESDKGETQMQTFALRRLTAADAAEKINSLYANLPKEAKRPTVLPLAELGKLTVVGPRPLVAQAAALLGEIDPGSTNANTPAQPEWRALTIALKHITGAQAEATVTRLLTPRQSALVKYAAAPDAKSIILTGPDADVASLQQLIQSLDTPQTDREVRLIKLAKGDPAKIMQKAEALYSATSRAKTEPISLSLDAPSRTATLIGTRAALAEFSALLTSAETAAVIETETRSFDLAAAKPSELAPLVLRLARPLLAPTDGGEYREPVADSIDETRTLVLRADPNHFAVLERLVRSLDTQRAGERSVRVIPITTGNAEQLRVKAIELYTPQIGPATHAKPVEVTADAASNTLLAVADATSLDLFTKIVSELQRQTAAPRDLHLIELKNIPAAEAASFLRDLAKSSQPVRASGPEPVIEPIDATNALLVSAQPAQLAVIEALVKNLDAQRAAERPPVRLTRLKAADANAVAATLRANFDKRTPDQKNKSPFDVTADAPTNTLLISAANDLWPEIDRLITGLNTETSTTLRVIPLKHARAERLQSFILQILLNRARESASVPRGTDPRQAIEVAADPASNTLVIAAPEAIAPAAEELLKSLDQPAAAGLIDTRVFVLERGDAASAANALRAGLEAALLPGDAKPVITAEPASNTVVVSGTRAQIEKAAALIQPMDASAETGGFAVRTVILKHARAEALAPVVQAVVTRESAIDKLPEWSRAQFLARQNGKEPATPKVSAEKRLNALIVSGPPAALELAEQVIAQLDADPSAGQRRDVRILTLQNADAGELALSAAAIFSEDKSAEPPTVRVDRASNSLIVRGTDEHVKAIEGLVSKVDAATLGAVRQLRLVPIDPSKADAALMAETLRKLLEQQGGVKVEVISAQELLKRTGAEPKSKSDSGGIPGFGGPHPGRVLDVVLTAVIAITPNEQPAASDQPTVTIAVDPATNSLVIVGSPRIADRLVSLAAELERQMPSEPVSVKFVTLPQSTDARQLAAIVNQTVQQVGRRAPGNPGGMTGPVSVTADPDGGALIVLANQTDFSTVGELIASISKLDSTAKSVVKIYPLSSITGPRAAAAINDLLSPTPRGQQAQRVRQVELSLTGPDGQAVVGAIDPTRVKVSSDPGGASVIVTAPAEMLPLIDRFVALIDQSPVKDRLAIKRYTLAHARASDLARDFQAVLDAQRQGPAAQEMPRATLIADERTNTVLVAASEPQHSDVKRLLESADVSIEDKDLELAIIPLQQASPSTVARIVDQVVIGKNPGLRDRVRVSAEDSSSLFVVRAPKEQIAQVRTLVEQVDSSETTGLPVRSVKLERADAGSVASALQKFFADRAQVSSRPGQRAANRVAVVGDRRSGTLVVAASDEDFAQVQSLAATFDKPGEAGNLTFRIIPLKHARVSDVEPTISNIADEMRWEQRWGGRGDETKDAVYIESNERSNSLVVMGPPDAIASVEKVVAALDLPQSERTQLTVKVQSVANADLQSVKQVVERAMQTPGWRSWRGPDPDAVTVEIDRRRKSVLVVGKGERVEQAVGYIKELDAAGATAGQQIRTIALKHAKAGRAAESLRQFFGERARALGLNEQPVSVIGSADGNVLIVSADAENTKTVEDLVAQIDQPDLGKDRRFEIYYLKNSSVQDAGSTLRSIFARSSGGGGGGDEQVVVIPQPSTGSLIVSAPGEIFEQITALVKQLDQPPSGETANMTTVTLGSSKASEMAAALKSALPANVKVTITPVPRSNSLVLTGSTEAINVVVKQIEKLDTEPVKSLYAFKRVKLKNAMADDAYFTVAQILRSRPRADDGRQQASVDYSMTDNTISISAPQDQIEEIASIVESLDTPTATARKTEFVKLQYANAQATGKALEVFYGRFAPEAPSPAARNVTIVPDPASNSLVISAEAAEWEGIRALLTKLDTKEYDTSRQLSVIRLVHADAASVARALNEGFRAPLEDEARRELLRRERSRSFGGDRGRDEERFFEPAVLVDDEGRPTVSAEQQTNSLVVFAGPRDLERVRAIVSQLDVPGFANMPEPRIIPLTGTAKPSALASSIREIFVLGPGGARGTGPRSVVVLGDDVSGALIVRADEAQFAQIKALAETLQQKGELTRLMPEVIKLKHVPAARLRQTLIATFTPLAQQMGETLAVEVDRGSNTLVVMCSPRLKAELAKVVAELDVPAFGEHPGVEGATRLGQSVFVVDVKNNAPEAVKKAVDELGLSRPQPADRPGVVTEPVTVVTLATRRALAVLASPGDAATVIELIKAIDAEPIAPEQRVSVVALQKASAGPLVATLKSMLTPGEKDGVTGPAAALAEQVRRLSIAGNGLDKPELKLDLAVPIRLIPDAETNSVIIASSAGNVAALLDVVKTLDTLPVGEAVIVRMFPLANASAPRIKGVIDELFQQGEALRRLPGTRRQGLPTTTTGKALAGEIAVSVDERTNLLIVAGREEAVAFVEVLVKDLDSDETSKWIEPSIIALQHADAVPLAQKLRQVLVQGTATTPEAIGLQKQFGRLRMAAGSKADRPGDVEADLFAPVTSLVITPEEQTNSLIVVGTPANLAVVKQLVAMLDVERASAANTVRPFPLRHASADRVAAIVREIFRQREETGASRPEDRVIVSADARTNALIVSTSPRSFAILETLMKSLDAEESHASVGLRVLAVPNADVKVLAPRIEKLMRERIDAGLRAGSVKSAADAFSIEAEPVNNLLIVAASDENFGVVKELVEALTADAERLAGAEKTDLIQMNRIPAGEAAASLKSLYVDRENERRGEGAVSVTANDRLNSLIVSGTDRDIAEIRALAAQLDSAEVKTVRTIERIELKSANALEVVRLLENVLAGRPLSGTSSGLGQKQATKIQFFRESLVKEFEGEEGRTPTEAEVDGVIRDHVTLTPDLRSNSVVVAAPPQVCALVREIVIDLDSTAAGSRKIEQFHLKNADARQMAELLRDTFDLRQQGNSYVLLPTPAAETKPGEPEASKPEGFAGMSVTAVPDERQRLSIAIDARTNTLIVSGTDEYLDLVRTLVTDLDKIEAVERQRTVYHLRNAKAKLIEETMAKYFRGEADLQRTTLGPDQTGSLRRQLEQEVTVIGDEKSNKLVISSSPRFTETVLKIVEELDSAPPQVMIQVLLAEVTIDADDTWGVDFSLGPFNGPGITYSTKAGGAGVTTSLGVPNLSVTSADFSLLVRALEAQGKLEVLSNPQLLVSNNEIGKIQVGENIAIAEGVERTPQGGTFSSVKRQDVGIILNVTPSINADGFVRMDISPEISSVGTKTDQITEDFAAARIQKRTLDTIVTVKDGQSVVIGGLLQSTEEKRISKVPFLGDIPVIGWPFRTEQDRNVKTELLVVLTPQIVPGAALNGAAGDYHDRVDWIGERQINRLQDPVKVQQYIRDISVPPAERQDGPMHPVPEGEK